MASLVRQHDRFYLQFYSADRSPQRRRVPLHVTVKRDAESVRRKLERDYSLGTFDPWTDDPLTYDQVVSKPERMGEARDAFLDAKRHKAARTVEEYGKTLDRFTAHVGASTLVSNVTTKNVEAWLDSTDAGNVTRHGYVRTLKVFLRWARKKGLTSTVATDGVRLRRLPRKHPRFLTQKEVDRIVTAVREEARTAHWLADLIPFACHTGLRRSELVNLTWNAVDLDRRTLTVENTETFETKSGADRTVPLSDTAVSILERLATDADEGYVWTHSDGQIDPDYLSKAFKRYARKAGLDDVHLHHTRHTACSWLAQRGVPIDAIRQFAGHSTVTVTEKYMHLSDDVYARQITSALTQ